MPVTRLNLASVPTLVSLLLPGRDLHDHSVGGCLTVAVLMALVFSGCQGHDTETAKQPPKVPGTVFKSDGSFEVWGIRSGMTPEEVTTIIKEVVDQLHQEMDVVPDVREILPPAWLQEHVAPLDLYTLQFLFTDDRHLYKLCLRWDGSDWFEYVTPRLGSVDDYEKLQAQKSALEALFGTSNVQGPVSRIYPYKDGPQDLLYVEITDYAVQNRGQQLGMRRTRRRTQSTKKQLRQCSLGTEVILDRLEAMKGYIAQDARLSLLTL